MIIAALIVALAGQGSEPPAAPPTADRTTPTDPSDSPAGDSDPAEAPREAADPAKAAPPPSKEEERTAASDGPDDAAEKSAAKRTAEVDPLPVAPPREDPSSLVTTAWRGRGWFQIALAAVVPLGGQRPAAGTVVAAAGGVQVGWRPLPWLGVGMGVVTFVHDAAATEVLDQTTGERSRIEDLGRITAFDIATLRFFVPTRHRVEPRFDLGPMVGTYRPPFSERAPLAWGIRGGAGIDVWVGPSFSLDFGVDPRMLVVEGAVAVSLQAGMGATVHW